MRTAAFFDLDGTLLRGESQLSFLLWCMKRRIVPPVRSLNVASRYAFYLLGITRDALAIRKQGFHLLKGVEAKCLEAAGKVFFHDCLIQRLHKHSQTLVDAHRKRGHVIVLVTAACEVVARPVAEWLKADALIATKLLQEQGALTGTRELPEPYGMGKSLLIKKFSTERHIDLSRSFACTDHHSDLPLLMMVGHPCVVNPTKRLHSIAEDRRWPVLNLNLLEILD